MGWKEGDTTKVLEFIWRLSFAWALHTVMEASRAYVVNISRHSRSWDGVMSLCCTALGYENLIISSSLCHISPDVPGRVSMRRTHDFQLH